MFGFRPILYSIAFLTALAAPAQADTTQANARDNASNDVLASFDSAFGTEMRAPTTFKAIYANSFEQQIAEVADGSKGRIGVYAVDLASGEEVSILADMRFPMASTSKVAVAATFLAGVDQGKFDLNDEFPLLIPRRSARFSSPKAPVRLGNRVPAYELISLMISKSCNSCTDALLNAVGGPKAVNAWMRNTAGITEFNLTRDIATLVRDDGEHEGDRGMIEAAIARLQQERPGRRPREPVHLHACPQIGEVGGEVALGGERGEVGLQRLPRHLGHLVVGGAALRERGDPSSRDAGLHGQGVVVVGDRLVEVGQQRQHGHVAGLDRRVCGEVHVALGGAGLLAVDQPPRHATNAHRKVQRREVGPGHRHPLSARARGSLGEPAVRRRRLAVSYQLGGLLDGPNRGLGRLGLGDLDQRRQIAPGVPVAHRDRALPIARRHGALAARQREARDEGQQQEGRAHGRGP